MPNSYLRIVVDVCGPVSASPSPVGITTRVVSRVHILVANEPRIHSRVPFEVVSKGKKRTQKALVFFKSRVESTAFVHLGSLSTYVPSRLMSVLKVEQDALSSLAESAFQAELAQTVHDAVISGGQPTSPYANMYIDVLPKVLARCLGYATKRQVKRKHCVL